MLPMQIIRHVKEMRSLAVTWKGQALNIGVVPTMGCLHAGHLSLMRLARERCDRVVVTIFVNPLQFGPNEDFTAYPRQLQQDCQLAESVGVDAIFAPENGELYPPGFQTVVQVGELSKGMCGGSRPGHFDGVATVVSKLLLLTAADVGVFGEKDFQQLTIIRRMVSDLHIPVEIVGAPIVREEDGLAMSSRNKYLKGEMRRHALCLYQAILEAQRMAASTQPGHAAGEILARVRTIVADAGGLVDYAVIIDERTLKDTELIDRHARLALAIKIGGKVRLLDNARLLPGPS
jgi:pantoate--beta-alanine ligase